MTTGDVEILLVEDNPRDVEMMLRALKEHNLANHVHVAKDGAEALDFFFATGAGVDRTPNPTPRVVLLDLKLPKVSGMEVLKKLKSDERTRTIPVVVLTSSQEEKDMVESYKLGVNSYIVKPVGFDKFIKAIGEVGLYWLLINKPLI
ncbi:MAG: response regulator [Kiritimatiellales bacterium]|nr:response regulator [Kiritimatiellales bacterium]